MYVRVGVCALSCVRLFVMDHMNHNSPDSSVCEISQSRILEWVAVSSSRGSSQLRDQNHTFCVSYTGSQIPYQLRQPGKPSRKR